MRLRKKQSKRTSTRLKEGIKKKAAAQHRKEKKHAKKDVTWKSRHKKDPGIPSSFPYKNKILEAIEQKKQQDLEEKERKRLEKIELKKQQAAMNNEEYVEDADMMSENEEGEGGLSALMASAQQAAEDYEKGDLAFSKKNSAENQQELEIQDIELDFESDDQSQYEGSELEKSRKAYDKIFKTVVDNADVVLYVLDARDPEGTRSRKVEEAVLQTNGEKKLVLVLNKVDLVPPFVLEQWLTFLKSSFPTIPFKASTNAVNSTSFNKKLTTSNTSNGLLESLKKYANNRNFKRSIVVGVIGYPNVGKSSIINALTSSRRGNSTTVCPVGNQAGVTTSLREVKIDGKLKIMDSPGIVFPSELKSKNKVDKEAELALLSALPPKYIIDPYPAVLKLVKRVSKSEEMTESFKKLYELPPIPANDPNTFTKHFLIHVARKRGRIGKGGIPDITGAGLSVLTDWRDGRIMGWVLPKSSKQSSLQAIEEQQQQQQQQPVEQTSIVSEFSAEFDLDSLFASLDSAIEEQK
ncbi:nuclear GTP-binding protein nug1 [Hanseniaspora vineae]